MNSVLFHPSLLHIVTAGIERHVILHSPTKSSPCTQDLASTPTTVRELPAGTPEDRSRFIRAITLGQGADDSGEDAETIALFDEYVLRVTTKLRVISRRFQTEYLERRVRVMIYS